MSGLRSHGLTDRPLNSANETPFLHRFASAKDDFFALFLHSCLKLLNYLITFFAVSEKCLIFAPVNCILKIGLLV